MRRRKWRSLENGALIMNKRKSEVIEQISVLLNLRLIHFRLVEKQEGMAMVHPCIVPSLLEDPICRLGS